MSKKNLSKPDAISQDSDLKLAWKKYGVGNFYAARALARAILSREKSPAASRQQAGQILAMSSVDPWALAAGLAVLTFSVIVAFLVAY